MPAFRRSGTTVAVITAVAMIAQQVGAKATRDALFLGSYPASDLPKVMITAAMLGGISVFALSSGYARWSPARLVPWVFGLNAACFFMEWWFVRASPAVIAVLVYVHVAMLGAAVISGFWSVVNERYDPHAARGAVAKITAGSALGGVLGAVITERASTFLQVDAMLIILSGLNAACALLVGWLSRGLRTSPAAKEANLRSSIETLQRSPYLQRIALVVALVSVAGTLLDFAFKAEADARLDSEAALASFFAIFYTVTSVTGFVLQAGLSSRSLNRLGLERTLFVLPVTVIAFSALGVAFTRLWTLALVRGAESALENSLFRSGYELLYVPVPAEKKRPTKVIIDVGFRRAGDLLGGGAALFVVGVLPDQAIPIVVALAGLLALVVRGSMRKVYKGYVDQLVTGLEVGSIDESEAPALDPTTRRLVTQTLAIDRERLLARIAEFRDFESSEEVLRARKELRAGISETRVPWAISLLGHRELASEASTALAAVAPEITDRLVDALSNPVAGDAVRRRLPAILADAEPRRALEGLFNALGDPSFEVRAAAGRALADLLGREPDLALSKSQIFPLVEREIEEGKQSWDSAVWSEARVLGSADQDGLVVDRRQRGLNHVFTLLGFVLDGEALKLAQRALDDPAPKMRGTALEYLENVLPDSIRDKLWPFIGGPIGRSRGSRTREQLVKELMRLR